MGCVRDDDGIVEWFDDDHPDQYVVLVSPHLDCSCEVLERVMQRHLAKPVDDGDFESPDTDWLRQELARELGRAIDVEAWRDPAGVLEYTVEVQGRRRDWEWP